MPAKGFEQWKLLKVEHSRVVDTPAPLRVVQFIGDFSDSSRVNPVLLDLNAGMKRGRGVSWENRNRCLIDYGAGIHSRVDIMDGASTLRSVCLDRLSPRIEAGKLGQK